jgi:hypothetical protein
MMVELHQHFTSAVMHVYQGQHAYLCLSPLPSVLLKQQHAPVCTQPALPPGATIHTTAGLWMTVKPRQNIPQHAPAPAAAAAAHHSSNGASNGHAHDSSSNGSSSSGCPMHQGGAVKQAAQQEARETVRV